MTEGDRRLLKAADIMTTGAILATGEVGVTTLYDGASKLAVGPSTVDRAVGAGKILLGLSSAVATGEVFRWKKNVKERLEKEEK